MSLENISCGPLLLPHHAHSPGSEPGLDLRAGQDAEIVAVGTADDMTCGGWMFGVATDSK